MKTATLRAKPGPPGAPGKVRINIQLGSTSPAQKAAWRKFWQRLIAEVKSGSDVDE